MDDFDGLRTVTRRQVLKGGAAVAALGGVSAFLAACSSTGATAAPATAAPAARRQRSRRRARPRCAGQRRSRQRHARRRQLQLRPRPEGRHGRRSSTASRQTTGVTVNAQHGRPRHVPGPDQLVPRRARRTTCSPGSPASGCASSPIRARDRHQRRVGQGRSNYSDAFKRRSTGDDGKQYFIPFYNYPWAVFYRKSVFADKGYTIPTTMDEFKTLADKMKADGLIPMAFGDKDGWPAMGTFDILNLRHERLRLPRRADGGRREVDGPEDQGGLRDLEGAPPLLSTRTPPAAPGRTPPDTLVQKKAGMYLLGLFVSAQFAGDRRPGRPRRPRLLPLPDLRAPSSTPRRRSTPRSTAS